MAASRKGFVEGIRLIASAIAATLKGELRTDDSTGDLKHHDGTSERTVVNTDKAQTLTNKTIVASSNTISGIANSNIDNAAAIAYSKLNLSGSITTADLASSISIARDKIAAGTSNSVIINDGSGNLSYEANLAKSRGGAGADMSNVTFPSNGRLLSGFTYATSVSYTVTNTDGVNTVLVTTSSTNRTITLPAANANAHRLITIKKVDSGTGIVTITPNGSDTINSLTTAAIFSLDDVITLQSDGSAKWHVISSRVFEYLHNSNTTTTAGASDTTSFSYGSSGTAFVAVASTTVNSVTAKRIRCQTNINVNDKFSIEIRDTGDTGNKWHTISACSGRIQPLITLNTSVYGMDIDRVDDSATDFNVEFGNCGRISNASTYGGTNASPWSEVTTWNWRVRREVHY